MPTNMVGLGAMLSGTWYVVTRAVDVDVAVPLLMALTAAPILLGDLVVGKVHLRPSTGIDWALSRPFDLARVSTKLVGLVSAAGLILSAYWLFPEYQGSFYDHYYTFLRTYGPPAAILAIPYFMLLDRKLVDPQDKYWHLGAMLTGRGDQADRDEALDLLRGWVIKGFFIPLMYIYTVKNIIDLRELIERDQAWFLYWYDILWSAGFLIDVTFTTMGYILSLRIVDTHIRSSEPTMLGWFVAMICYQPFFSMLGGQYLAYDNGFYWGEAFEPWPWLKYAWGAGLLTTTVVFSGSTVAFGCRFSNLTHRGIITNGFYRYTKHPAYWSKLISFWMLFVPFWYRGSGYQVIRDCTMLAALAGVYFLRARTEEHHLSRDPDYVRYALWINDHGVFRILGRLVPALRYRPPEGWAAQK